MLNLSISYVFHHFSTSRQVVEKLIIIKLPPYLGGSKSINTFIRVGYKLNFWTICPKVKTSGHIDPKLITPRHDVAKLTRSYKIYFFCLFLWQLWQLWRLWQFLWRARKTVILVIVVITVISEVLKLVLSSHCCTW